MAFNLGDAVGDQGGPWPEQPKHPAWPGQPSGNPVWQGGGGGGNTNPVWQGGGGGGNPNTAWQGGGGNPNTAWQGGGGNTNPAWQGGGGNPNPAWQPSAPQPSGPAGWFNPSPGPGSGPGPGPAGTVLPQQTLTVPHNLPLPNGVYDKLLITVAGTVKPHADKFTLDFNTSSGDLAFHFNPRFNDQGKKAIVRNSCIGKKWGKEERELPRFPFVQGQRFEIKILCTNTEFKVAVNNSHLLEYKHRYPRLRDIMRLNIYNDITLSNVTAETLP